MATTRLSSVQILKTFTSPLRSEFSICRRKFWLCLYLGVYVKRWLEFCWCISLFEWSQYTLCATSSCLTWTILHQGFNLTAHMVHGMKLVVCITEHIPENANKAIIWWGLPCSNLWPLKSEGKLFSEDVPQDRWKVVRLSWGFKLLFFGNSQFFWEQLLLEMKSKWIKIALMMPTKEK